MSKKTASNKRIEQINSDIVQLWQSYTANETARSNILQGFEQAISVYAEHEPVAIFFKTLLQAFLDSEVEK